jgi:hypothetical protein
VSDIKPRMEGGVGYCNAECPYYNETDQPEFSVEIENSLCAMGRANRPCPVWTARMAAWAEEAREWISSEMYDPHQGGGYKLLRTYPGGNDQTQDGNGGE